MATDMPGPISRAETEDLRGALFMTASTAGFVINDALMKAISAHMPLPPVLFLRGLWSSGLLLLLLVLQGAVRYRPDRATTRRLSLRVLCEIGATFSFLYALFNMPIANAAAIMMATPLVVTLGAALLFGEAVGWRRWTAIGVGFAGVLLIVRPGNSHFNVYALSALAAVAFTVGRDLYTRSFPLTVPSSFVALTTAVAVTAAGGVLTPLTGWGAPDLPVVLMLGAAAVGLVVGYLFIVMAMRTGDVGFVSPFRYTVLLWALILGFVVFDELPDRLTLAGSLIVVGTGIYTLQQGRAPQRQTAPLPRGSSR